MASMADVFRADLIEESPELNVVNPIDVARQYLESAAELEPSEDKAHFLALPLRGLRVLDLSYGRCLCCFRVPRVLTDGEGRWQAGAIAALIDEVGANTIKSVQPRRPGGRGVIDGEVSVQLEISYLSTAAAGEEVEVEGRVEHRKGRAVAAVVEIRKKESGAPVAAGRLWMLSVSIRSRI